MAEFLINERSRALLDLVDAFMLSESELRDVWDGIFNRICEIAEIVKAEEANEKSKLFKPIGFDDPMMYACDMCQGSGYIESTDDTEDWECPKCGGSGVLSEDYVVSQELADKEDEVKEVVKEQIEAVEKYGSEEDTEGLVKGQIEAVEQYISEEEKEDIPF